MQSTESAGVPQELLPYLFWYEYFMSAFVAIRLAFRARALRVAMALATTAVSWCCHDAWAQSAASSDALSQGEQLLAAHRDLEAMAQFESVLANSPHDARARDGERQAAIAVALGEKKAGRGDEALLFLMRARKALPDDVTVLTYLGVQAQVMHQLPLAAGALHEALVLKPSDPTALYALARVELDQDHFAASEQLFREYLAQRPGDSSAHYGLGHLYQKQLRIDEARTEFNRSIALQPIQTESYYQLGEMALDSGDREEAQRMFAKTLQRMPAHGGALTGTGILAYRAKQYEAARDSLKAAVASSPDYQTAHYYLGLTLGRLGDKAGSERELREATDLALTQQGKGQPVVVLPAY